MKRIFAILFLVFSLFSCSGNEEEKPKQSKVLIWSDEFDYTGLPDDTKWDYEYGFVRNKEDQFYMKERLENSEVKDGNLIITSRKERFKNPWYKEGSPDWQRNREYVEYTSASVITRGKFSVKYGRIEVRAKLPGGKGTWPAIWMLGDNISEVNWPRCGEIDIMEYLARNSDQIYGTCHYGDKDGKHRSDGKHISVDPKPTKDFHIYAINWYPDKIDFFYDNRKYFTFRTDQANVGNNNAFHKPFYLLMNLALGGWGGEIDNSVMPQEYFIDYVRIYRLEE
ncbi:MAG: glycoside hydrolase family 16 protein [Flavobacteriia bacterium]|nr:MAG: glycoside hydrolase family 16 protein [Flavobacteriia bacterium]